MSTTTLGLSYLDEQQRFRRPASRAVVPKTKPVVIDFQIAKRPVVPVAKSLTPIALQHPDGAIQRTSVVLAPTLQPKPEEVQTVFAEQFEEEVQSKRKKIFKILPIAVAAIALVSGLAVLGISLRQNHKAAAQVTAITEKSEGAGAADPPPSEEAVTPAAIGKYAVAPDMPRVITIKKINVTARILSLGVLSSGALATPRNTNDTGWYNGSSKPGTGGAALIVGHVSGLKSAGIFYNLKKLDAGDTITVERGDGSKIEYRVVQKEQMVSESVDMSKLLVPVTVGKAGLNLMTCGGKYDSDKETFKDRVLIYAEQI